MFLFKNAALLIIDMQNDFVYNKKSPVYIPSAKKIIDNVISAGKIFRKRRSRIIHIITSHPQDIKQCGYMDKKLDRYYCLENSEGEKIIPELLNKNKSDLVIRKRFYSGFYGTELLKNLREKKITRLFFAGLTTGCCISSTAREAYNYNFELYFISDCMTSSLKSAHKSELRFFQKSLGEVIELHYLRGKINV